MLLLGSDQRVLVVSDQFCRLLDLPLTPAQVVGLGLPPLIALVRGQVADPAAYDHELTVTPTAITHSSSLLRLRTGRLLERDVRPVALCDQTGWLLSYRDVTAQHEAEAQRDAQRVFYETILDEVPAEIAVLDEQQRYAYANIQAVPDPEHRAWLPGRTLAEYCTRYGFPLSLAAQRERMFREAEKSTATVFWDDRTPRPEGDLYHQRQFKLLAGAGRGLPYMLGSGLDVTARVQAEERSQRSEAARREQQEFMQLVLDTNPNPVYVRDAAGEVVFSNRALRRLDEHPAALPLTPEVAQAKAREAAHYARVDAQVLATGQEVQAEECSTSPTGEPRWFYTVKRPLVRPDGTVQVLGVSTDITALKAAQLAAEEAAQARENFLANMSHEIRTPMNGVLGVAALLAKTPLNPQQQEFVRTIRSAGGHLLGVLNDVLDVAKINADKLTLEATAFDLHASVQQAVATLALEAQEKGLAFGFRPFAPGEACWVLSDPFRLNQILLNLLTNAIKFTPGGSVWLRSYLVGETEEELLVRFEVRDTGIGIGDDALERIFESFTQAQADITRRYGGTGLGLTISRALVAQLGGELHVSSQLGQGSSFSFTLPLAKTQPPAPTPPRCLRYRPAARRAGAAGRRQPREPPGGPPAPGAVGRGRGRSPGRPGRPGAARNPPLRCRAARYSDARPERPGSDPPPAPPARCPACRRAGAGAHGQRAAQRPREVPGGRHQRLPGQAFCRGRPARPAAGPAASAQLPTPPAGLRPERAAPRGAGPPRLRGRHGAGVFDPRAAGPDPAARRGRGPRLGAGSRTGPLPQAQPAHAPNCRRCSCATHAGSAS